MNPPVPSYSISILSASDERWQSLLARNAEANIFHHPAWSQLLADCYGFHPFVCGVCNENNEIVAGLPVIEINKWLRGRRWVSLPFTDHCSPVYEDTAALNCLLDGLLYLASKQELQELELREEVNRTLPLHFFSPYVLHTVPLDIDFSKVACRIHEMHRRNARAAQKRGISVEISRAPECIKTFYRIHIETRRHMGLPVQPWRFFHLLSQRLIEKGLGSVLLAFHEQRPVAGMVLLGWGHTLTYKYGASCRDALHFRPNDLLFWTAIQWGCEHNYKVFDLGRTDISNQGLRTFKSFWGADETPLVYSYLSPKKHRFSPGRWESLVHKIIQRSPIWVCRYAGELLYGRIN